MNMLQVDDATFEFPWAQMENEPDEWYERFATYYLALGHARTLRKAYLVFLGENNPARMEHYLDRPALKGAEDWIEMCNLWKWRERAVVYDRETLANARELVEDARRTLFASALEAANALRKALADPRMRVAAAKEILNRVGLPAVTEVNLSARPFGTDEYNQAAEEVQEWEQRMSEKTLPDGNG